MDFPSSLVAGERVTTDLMRLFVYFPSTHMFVQNRPPKDDLIHAPDHNSAKCVAVKWATDRVEARSMARLLPR